MGSFDGRVERNNTDDLLQPPVTTFNPGSPHVHAPQIMLLCLLYPDLVRLAVYKHIFCDAFKMAIPIVLRYIASSASH